MDCKRAQRELDANLLELSIELYIHLAECLTCALYASELLKNREVAVVCLWSHTYLPFQWDQNDLKGPFEPIGLVLLRHKRLCIACQQEETSIKRFVAGFKEALNAN
jgi:hypothetical protein